MRSTRFNPKLTFGQLALSLVLGLAISFAAVAQAYAGSFLVVAIGADNVAGVGRGRHYSGGVPRSEAFPAQLEALLRTQNVDALVLNAGVPGDTSPDILARLDSAVPDGTRLVLLDLPNGNDGQAGLLDQQTGYVDRIRARLTARHIELYILPKWEEIPGANENRDPDGHHFTAAGHAAIAAYLLPKVVTIMGAQAR